LRPVREGPLSLAYCNRSGWGFGFHAEKLGLGGGGVWWGRLEDRRKFRDHVQEWRN